MHMPSYMLLVLEVRIEGGKKVNDIMIKISNQAVGLLYSETGFFPIVNYTFSCSFQGQAVVWFNIIEIFCDL